jgi:hypothetical protein
MSEDQRDARVSVSGVAWSCVGVDDLTVELLRGAFSAVARGPQEVQQRRPNP